MRTLANYVTHLFRASPAKYMYVQQRSRFNTASRCVYYVQNARPTHKTSTFNFKSNIMYIYICIYIYIYSKDAFCNLMIASCARAQFGFDAFIPMEPKHLHNR